MSGEGSMSGDGALFPLESAPLRRRNRNELPVVMPSVVVPTAIAAVAAAVSAVAPTMMIVMRFSWCAADKAESDEGKNSDKNLFHK